LNERLPLAFGVIVEILQDNSASRLNEWRKARRSMGNGNCVEISSIGTAVVVRDSQDPVGPEIAYSSVSWREFAREARAGHFDATKI
jgi:Domain of unknown function (DUF397)